MTPEQELEWHRDWRKRLLAKMREWWRPANYAAACKAWTEVQIILKEQPEPTEGETR